VIRDLATPLDADELDPAALEVGRGSAHMRVVGVLAEGQDRRMLEQQELVRDRIVRPLIREAMLEVPRFAIGDPAKPASVQPIIGGRVAPLGDVREPLLHSPDDSRRSCQLR